MMLQLDYKALIGLAIAFILCYKLIVNFFSKFQSPSLFFSNLNNLSKRKQTLLEKFSHFPSFIYACGMGILCFALIDPHLLIEDTDTKSPPHEGLAFYLVLDRSGSMGKVVEKAHQKGTLNVGTRFNQLQAAANHLIQRFPNDLIGVMAFARSAEVIAPLTLDHKLLQKRIDKLNIVKDSSQDGTSIGYAIYKTAHLIAATKAFAEKQEGSLYNILSAFMIIITDGLQDPSLLDKGNRLRTMELEEASEFAKEKGIKVYIVNIEPRITEEQFAPNRRQMERITKATGGELIIANQLDTLEQTLLKIPAKEKSQFFKANNDIKTMRISYYPYLVGIALFFLGLYFTISLTIWRKAL